MSVQTDSSVITFVVLTDIVRKALPNEPFVFKTLGTMYMEFEWLGSKPQYGGTTSTYIWEPHTKPPSSTKAQLFIKGIDEQGPPNVLIVLSSWDLSNGSLVEYEKDRVYRRSLPSLASSNATTEIHLSIYALYRQIMKDTAIFLESAYEQVDKLVSFILPELGSLLNDQRLSTEI